MNRFPVPGPSSLTKEARRNEISQENLPRDDFPFPLRAHCSFNRAVVQRKPLSRTLDGRHVGLVRKTFQRHANCRRLEQHVINRFVIGGHCDDFRLDNLRGNEGLNKKMAGNLHEYNERPDIERGHCHGNIANAVVYGNGFETWLRLNFVGAYRLQRAVRDFVYYAAVNGVGQKFLRGGVGFGRESFQSVYERRPARTATEYLRGLFIGVHNVGGRLHNHALYKGRGRRHAHDGDLRAVEVGCAPRNVRAVYTGIFLCIDIRLAVCDKSSQAQKI